MYLTTLLQQLPFAVEIPHANPEITIITADSRKVMPGALFVAVRGETVDGHQFIAQAVRGGAAALVVEQAPDPLPACPVIVMPDTRDALGWLCAAFFNFPARQLVMIGVTGTDGKTTTASIIHQILLAAGLKAGLISTVAAYLGQETLDTGLHVTTPDAPEIQGYLARMVRAGLTHCVLEVTSHGLAQGRVVGCEFDIAVITNITHEHLDYHKTYENYRAAKAKLFESLLLSKPKPGVQKVSVLNRDDESFPYLSQVAHTRTLLYSLRGEADFVAYRMHYLPGGTQFQIATPKKAPIANLLFSTALVGEYNVSNCLAAITATVGALGLEPEAAEAGIAALPGVPGRMEALHLGQKFTAIVDFAHTPNALRRALETARRLTTKRVIAVFGSAGLRDVEKRRLMAETAAQLADISILTAEDPRTEALEGILEMMAFGARSQGGVEGQTFFRVGDRGEALRLAVRLAHPGDLVIACGKGHEQSMCFDTTEYAWDDRAALRAAIAELLNVAGPPMPVLPTSVNIGK